jgi:spore coat polysaccharide biosynthesis protein SpsF
MSRWQSAAKSDMPMSDYKIIGIVIARLDSSRLYGKALKSVDGLPLMGYVINRAKQVEGLAELVLATTQREVDTPLCDYAASQGIAVYRGDLEDVALRVLNCAKSRQADYFVRLNGDSPFIDPGILTEAISRCIEDDADFVSNIIERSFPYGVSVEVVKTATYEKAYQEMTTSEEHEHVTKYLYSHLSSFKTVSLKCPYGNMESYRLVVDTEEDFSLFEKLVGVLGVHIHSANFQEVVDALQVL